MSLTIHSSFHWSAVRFVGPFFDVFRTRCISGPSGMTSSFLPSSGVRIRAVGRIAPNAHAPISLFDPIGNGCAGTCTTMDIGTPMKTPKDEVRELLDTLPDDASLEDILVQEQRAAVGQLELPFCRATGPVNALFS